MAVINTVLTIGEVARVCNVAARTATKWFDSGQLRGYRRPGSNARRIPVARLHAFMRQYNMPLDGLVLHTTTRVLIADNDGEIIEMLCELLAQKTTYDVQVAHNGFEAGLIAEKVQPNVILLDLNLGDMHGREVCRMIRLNPTLQMTKVIAMSGQLTGAEGAALLGQGFDGFLNKPFHLQQVIQAVEDAACRLLPTSGARSRHTTVRISPARLQSRRAAERQLY